MKTGDFSVVVICSCSENSTVKEVVSFLEKLDVEVLGTASVYVFAKIKDIKQAEIIEVTEDNDCLKHIWLDKKY